MPGTGRRWRQPNISSLSRGRGKLGRGHRSGCCSSRWRGRRRRTGRRGCSAAGCGSSRWTGPMTDVPDSGENDAFFGRPSNQSRDGAFPQVRWVAAAESGTGSLLGAAHRARTGPRSRRWPWTCCPASARGCWCSRTASSCPGPWLAPSSPPGRTSCGAPRRASRCRPVKVLPDGTYLAELKPPRKSDGPPITVRVIEYTVHTARRAAAARSPRRCSAWSPACSTQRSTRRWTWRAATRTGGAARPSSATTRRTWARASPCCARKDPEGVTQEMWALFAVYQAICQLVGIARERRGHPPGHGSASRTPWPPRPTPSRLFPPDQLEHALATFLLKILMPGFYVRDRPTGPAHARPRKPATSPPANPASPASPTSPGASSSTCSIPGIT